MAMLEGASSVDRLAPKVDAHEETLIRRIQNGEQELFYELVKPHERRVYTAAFAILRNPADAEEVAQEAMLKAFTHLKQFRAEARFSTWLIQIAVNEARMRLRKDREFADWRELPSEALERSEIRQLLLEALASLKSKYREVFILRDIHHLSIEEVAATLEISRASVKTRLLRARLMLRDFLAPRMASGWFGREPFQKGNKPW
jgi:RNA polymerase sigma-70 factor (ECF subfamily)